MGMWINVGSYMGLGAHYHDLTVGSVIRAQPTIHFHIHRIHTLEPHWECDLLSKDPR